MRISLMVKTKRMDKLEYIPGDLVMTNGVPLGTAKDVVYRVTSSDPSKTLKINGTVLKGVVCLENIEGAEFGDKGYLLGDCYAWVKNIVPIPLTKDILLKNGWLVSRDSLFLKIDNNVTLGIVFAFEHKVCYIRATNDIIHKEQCFARLKLSDVDFVSDLQNILSIFHLNSEMKV